MARQGHWAFEVENSAIWETGRAPCEPALVGTRSSQLLYAIQLLNRRCTGYGKYNSDQHSS